MSDDGWVRFAWQWLDRSKRSSLTASAGGRQVDLWKDQICGDLGAPLLWVGDLATLLAEPEDDGGAATEATEAGKIPDDLGSEDVRLLHPELA